MEPKKTMQQESIFQRIRHSISDFAPSQSKIFGTPSAIYKRDTSFDRNHEEMKRTGMDVTSKSNINNTQISDSQRSASIPTSKPQMMRRSFPRDYKHASLPEGVLKNATKPNSTTKLLKPHDQNAPKRPISPMQATIMIQSDF